MTRNIKRDEMGSLNMRWVVAGACALMAGSALADAPVRVVLKDHRLVPAHITVPAGVRFKLELVNQDDTVDEFESYDLKVEKIVVSGATATVNAGPLHPGDYKMFDDYHPDTATGSVTAK
jgi:hypothetical protein